MHAKSAKPLRYTPAARKVSALALKTTENKGEKNMITCVGKKNGKYQIKESVPGIRLVFKGASLRQFEQVDVPKKTKQKVIFTLTVSYLLKAFHGFLCDGRKTIFCSPDRATFGRTTKRQKHAASHAK